MLEINREALTEAEREVLEDYPKITDRQAEMMLHALGADYKEETKRKTGKYYHAYRNYYDAGGTDADGWNDLKEKGYADGHENYYRVTVSGIRILEFLTHSRIYNNYRNYADSKRPAIDFIIRQDVTPCWGCWLPVSTKRLALGLAIPEKLARETMHRLEEEGLIHKGHYGEITDEGFPRCYHGYYPTKKLKETERYKKIEKEVEDEVNERNRKSVETQDGD